MASNRSKAAVGIIFERKPEVPLARFFITFDVHKDEASLDADFCKRLYADRELAAAFVEDARALLNKFEATYEKHYKGEKEARAKEAALTPVKKQTKTAKEPSAPAKATKKKAPAKPVKATKPMKGKARK